MTWTTRIPCLLLVWLCAARTLAAQQTLYLLDGDRLTGRLVRIADGQWVFSYAGAQLKLPEAAVTGLLATEPVGVRLADSTIGAATVAPVPAGLSLTFADGTTRTIAPADLAAVGDANHLAALRPVHIGLFSPLTRFWHATGSVGLSDKSGNSNARGASLSLNIERKTAHDRLSVSIAVQRESSEPPGGTFQATVGKYFGALRADLYLTPRFFTFVLSQQERDRFQDLALRSTYTAGLGVQAVSTPESDVRFWGSAGLTHERFFTAPNDQNAVAVAGCSLSQHVGPATLGWRFEGTPSLEDLSDYHFRSDASIGTALVAGIGVQLEAVNEFNHRPQPGVKQHDMLLTTTVTYSIGG